MSTHTRAIDVVQTHDIPTREPRIDLLLPLSCNCRALTLKALHDPPSRTKAWSPHPQIRVVPPFECHQPPRERLLEYDVAEGSEGCDAIATVARRDAQQCMSRRRELATHAFLARGIVILVIIGAASSSESVQSLRLSPLSCRSRCVVTAARSRREVLGLGPLSITKPTELGFGMDQARVPQKMP